jgi:hypothetical protein
MLNVSVTAEFTESPRNTISLQDTKMNGWGGGREIFGLLVRIVWGLTQ